MSLQDWFCAELLPLSFFNPLSFSEFSTDVFQKFCEVFSPPVVGGKLEEFSPSNYGWSNSTIILENELAIRSECRLLSFILLPPSDSKHHSSSCHMGNQEEVTKEQKKTSRNTFKFAKITVTEIYVDNAERVIKWREPVTRGNKISYSVLYNVNLVYLRCTKILIKIILCIVCNVSFLHLILMSKYILQCVIRRKIHLNTLKL